MANYTFENLSDIEFEYLVQDLLQEKFKLKLERFASGKDKGIDLRYSKTINNDLIVQCKKYRNFNSLYSNLKKEVEKVKRLNPLRYILVTSVSLNPAQKDKIFNLFKPFIKKKSDVLGREKLNNLLDDHSHIETRHFKLWLSSTNILNKILHSKVHNQSSFEMERVKENINIYVENISFAKALEILQKENHVIISGIPGIGKTTLARMISYYLLANGFTDFVFLSDNINEGYEFYTEDRKQVFLFDDFLGTNFLENRLNKNEEKRIVDFIEKIKKSKNKVLILTTREYILNQAKNQFEVIDRAKWDIAKYVIDLSKYTRPIRARILYNHLFFSKLPPEYIENLLENRRYLKIIDHPNYSPRIIEGITQKQNWETIQSGQFFNTFKKFLDYPESIWRHAFDNQISGLSKWLLLILATTGTPILLEDVRLAIQDFVKLKSQKYDLVYNDFSFKSALKELENSFITITKDSQENLLINFQNPSIYDFLKKYIEENNELIIDLIDTARFFNQLFGLFSYKSKVEGKIKMDVKIAEKALNRVLENFDYMGRSNLIQVVFRSDKERTYWRRLTQSDFYKLESILDQFDCTDKRVENFIRERILLQDLSQVTSDDQIYFLKIIKYFHGNIGIDGLKILYGLANGLENIGDVSNFIDLKSLYKKEFSQLVGQDDIRKKIESIAEIEVESSSSEDRDYLLSTLKEISEEIPIDIGGQIETLEEMIDDDARIENERWDHIDPEDFGTGHASGNEDQEIVDMFDGLKQSN